MSEPDELAREDGRLKAEPWAIHAFNDLGRLSGRLGTGEAIAPPVGRFAGGSLVVVPLSMIVWVAEVVIAPTVVALVFMDWAFMPRMGAPMRGRRHADMIVVPDATTHLPGSGRPEHERNQQPRYAPSSSERGTIQGSHLRIGPCPAPIGQWQVQTKLMVGMPSKQRSAANTATLDRCGKNLLPECRRSAEGRGDTPFLSVISDAACNAPILHRMWRKSGPAARSGRMWPQPNGNLGTASIARPGRSSRTGRRGPSTESRRIRTSGTSRPVRPVPPSSHSQWPPKPPTAQTRPARTWGNALSWTDSY